MSSAETENITVRREERVVFSVAIGGLCSPLPFRLSLADLLVLLLCQLPRPSRDTPFLVIPYLSVYRSSPL